MTRDLALHAQLRGARPEARNGFGMTGATSLSSRAKRGIYPYRQAEISRLLAMTWRDNRNDTESQSERRGETLTMTITATSARY